jgi:hypothetical protein
MAKEAGMTTSARVTNVDSTTRSGLVDFGGSGGNKSDETPENEAAENSKASAPHRDRASSPGER